MDLLVLPQDPAFPLEDAPFVNGQEWDCGQFITYPRRTDRMYLIPFNLQVKFSELSPPVGRDWRVLDWREATSNHEDVFQAWLYFGLMAEFLALNEREDGSRAVDLDSAKQELAQLMRDCARGGEGSSRVLVGGPFVLLREKALERFLRERSNMPARALYMSRCLNVARETVRYADWGLRGPVRTAVAALGQLLVYMLRNFLRAADLSILPDQGYWTSWAMGCEGADAPLWNQMIRAGWCPGDLERFKQQFGYLSAIHYASRLKLPPSRYTHENCSVAGCVAAQIYPSTYKLLHARDGCTCATAGTDQDQLTDILNSSDHTYPVLRLIKGTGSPAIEVVVERRKPDVPFVAISHVWADGLGNPSANCIQSCQLARLASLVASLKSNDSRVEYRIWLDTLCCPIAAAGKKIAHQRMANVYREAAHVLVLDSALEACQFDNLSGPEKYVRIFATSSWVKRLWTLQEGALNGSLFFRFAERSVSVSELKQLLQQHDSEDDLGSLCQCINELFDGLQVQVGKHPLNRQPEMPLLSRLLAQLEHGIRHRSVSVPSDEALCISTLLGLGPQRVLGFDHHEHRMQSLWEVVSEVYGGFPADSIFFMGSDTLGAPGWRWAPRTLLKSGSDATWTAQDRHIGFSTHQIGSIVPQGLKVCFPGRLVKVSPWVPALRLDAWEHLSSRPNYPLIVKDGVSGKFMQMTFDLWGMPGTLPEPSLRHILASHGEFAVMHSTAIPLQRHLMGRVRGNHPSKPGYTETDPVPIEFTAHMRLFDIPQGAQMFFENVAQLAKKAAAHETSTNLAQSYNRSNSMNHEALEQVKDYMKQITAQRVAENADFREIALQALDNGESLDTLWEAMPNLCPFEVEFQHLPDTQQWIVD